MKGLKAKIDSGKGSKVAKKSTTRQNKKTEVKEDVYQFIRREKGDIFLRSSVIEQFAKVEVDIKEIDNELMLFELKRENYLKEVEILKMKIQLMERDKRDVETAIHHKKTEKKNIRILQSEYRSKICKELGEKVTKFGYNPDTYEVVLENS